MPRKKKALPVLLVTQGRMLKVEIGPRVEGKHAYPLYLQFFPWDVPNPREGIQWCQMSLTPEQYAKLIEGREVYPGFESYESMVEQLLARPEYHCACIICGEMFDSLEDLRKHWTKHEALINAISTTTE